MFMQSWTLDINRWYAQNGTFAASATLNSVTHPAGSYRLNGLTGECKQFQEFNCKYQNALSITNSSSSDFAGPIISNVIIHPPFLTLQLVVE